MGKERKYGRYFDYPADVFFLSFERCLCGEAIRITDSVFLQNLNSF